MASARVPGGGAVVYPDCDFRSLSESTLQFDWIVKIQGGLDLLFKDDPDVFVAADLLWYSVEGDNRTRTAPDAMVAFGRPKGHRGSYRQWEEGGIAPQVVFEILPPKKRRSDMARKFRFYQTYGVEEFYVYDPHRVRLAGWLRKDGSLRKIAEMDGWVSPRVDVRFDLSGEGLRLVGPDGRPFLTYVELFREVEEMKRQTGEIRRRSEEWDRQDDEARRRRDEAEHPSDAEWLRAERLAARLRALDEEPD